MGSKKKKASHSHLLGLPQILFGMMYDFDKSTCPFKRQLSTQEVYNFFDHREVDQRVKDFWPILREFTDFEHFANTIKQEKNNTVVNVDYTEDDPMFVIGYRKDTTTNRMMVELVENWNDKFELWEQPKTAEEAAPVEEKVAENVDK